MVNVRIESKDIKKKLEGEGNILFTNWHRFTKALVANRIRYPGSQCRKRRK